jgi:hypothetical protein
VVHQKAAENIYIRERGIEEEKKIGEEGIMF